MKAAWTSPANIALIKYWGKHGVQLPRNASLSITLSEARTTTSVELKKKKTNKIVEIEFLFANKHAERFAERIENYLASLAEDMPFIREYRLKISSENTFPHSAGIASSASSMSALALCLLTLAVRTGNKKPMHDFFTAASHYARLGSGSAARSVFGSFVLWGKTPLVKSASDDHAIAFPVEYHKNFGEVEDSILIVSDAEKKTGSRAGHALMQKHPMAAIHYANAGKRLKELLSALRKGDWDLFCQVTEAEALELHALMMTSAPPLLFMRPNTLAVIERIRDFREKNKVPVCFTLDAGPNVHVLYPYYEKKKVRNFIQAELLKYCEKKKVIYDSMGRGPQQIPEV